MKLSHIFTDDIRPGKLFNIPEQPINVMLDITNYCNNHCLFCYNPVDIAYRGDKPDITSLQRIVSIIGENGTKEILYLGGEPFSLPEMHTILRTGKKYNMFQRAVSNGSFLKDKGRCSDLKDSGLNEVGISFHSSHETVHDKLSGRRGSFREAMFAIDNSLSAGIATFIQYSPTRLNSGRDIIGLGKNIKRDFGDKIVYFDINRLLPLGQGNKHRDIFLEDDNWFHFLCDATELYQQGFTVHAELTPFCWLKHRVEVYGIADDIRDDLFKMNRGCFMWIAQLALDYRGRIKFCPAGTCVGPSLLEVKWPDFWTTWEEFEQYRSFLWNDICIDFETKSACKFFYRCLGGCKYSKGIHYGIDRYASNYFALNNKGRNIYEKNCEVK